MLGNSFGRLFRVTTVGESYGIGEGSGLAVIIDGVPPGLPLTDATMAKAQAADAVIVCLSDPSDWEN